jgi:hypothetical protein
MSHSSVSGDLQLPLFNPIRIELVGIGRILSEQLSTESSQIYRITPEQFEEFLCDRLFAMGFEPRRVGAINQKDGGVDILFWPRLNGAFPFLGAAQVKHHRPRVTLRSTLGFTLPPATAGSLKAFVQLARSQAAGKTLLKKQEVANLLHRGPTENFQNKKRLAMP